MALPKQTRKDLRNRLQLLQIDKEFQNAVSENPATLVDGLKQEDAVLILQLTGYLGFVHRGGGGGGSASFNFPPWPGGMPW